MSFSCLSRWCPVLIAVLVCTGSLLSTTHTAQPQQHSSNLGAPIRDRQRTFRRHVRSWHALRKQNVVLQQRDYSCGAAALATLIKYHLGSPATETSLILELIRMLSVEEMRERYQKGLSLADLRRLAVRLGHLASVGRLEFAELREAKTPLIVGIVVNGFEHFVVYRGTDDKYVYLADPARGNVRVPISTFEKQWQENAVLVIIKRGQKRPRQSPLQLQPDESLVGKQNWLYLRRQVSTKPALP